MPDENLERKQAEEQWADRIAETEADIGGRYYRGLLDTPGVEDEIRRKYPGVLDETYRRLALNIFRINR